MNFTRRLRHWITGKNLQRGFIGAGHGGGSTAGYSIANSVRFRASASAYFSRTFGTPTSANTSTTSFWFKKTSPAGGTPTAIFQAGGTATNNGVWSQWNSTDVVGISNSAGGALCTSSAVVRDPTAWNHFCIVNNAGTWTIYKNNQSIASGSGTCNINQASTAHYIGCAAGSSYFSDGNLAEFYFIDGQALTPSSFGQADPNNPNNWIPKAYSGTYGNNGFYLKFNDGTSATTLGYDRSGNGNNWTPSGISTTAGVTYDWLTDTPTNNYCTLNPLQRSSAVISNGNLNVTSATLRVGPAIGTISVDASDSNGFHYEVVPTQGLVSNYWFGWAKDGHEPYDASPSVNTGFIGIASNGSVYANGSFVGTFTSWIDNDVIGVGIKNGGMYVSKNGVAMNSGNAVVTGLTGTWRPFLSHGGSGTPVFAGYANFGQRPFAYTPPTGFKALCTANLPAVAIPNPSLHANVKLDTGANIKATCEATYTYLLEWIKDRANANNHQLIDSVRGANALHSNLADAPSAYSAPSGNSVGWVFNINGNSSPAVNATAGISVVTYTGNGSNRTVAHGLGVAPKFVIVKDTTAANVNQWAVWQQNLTSGAYYLVLNGTATQTSDATYWNSTIPDSTNISLGTANATNQNSHTYVAYCFAEIPGFSKFGAVAGNSSSDGPFVWCGFRPRYILWKCYSGGTGNWRVFDSARDADNGADSILLPNDAGAETTGSPVIDITANGFKWRMTSAGMNLSGESYIFAAFAESPFGGSNVSPACAR